MPTADNEMRMIRDDRCVAGSKVWFAGEKQGYTIRQRNMRYLILTKPCNLPFKKTIYCVVDLYSMWRGPENLIFPRGCVTDEQVDAMFARIVHRETEISRRRGIELSITKVEFAKLPYTKNPVTA